MMNRETLPEWIIIDVDHFNLGLQRSLAAARLGMIPIGDGDVYRLIFDEIYSDDASTESRLEVMVLDVLDEMMRVNDQAISMIVADIVRQLGFYIYEEAKRHRLYHKGALMWRYDHVDAHGSALYLQLHEAA